MARAIGRTRDGFLPFIVFHRVGALSARAIVGAQPRGPEAPDPYRLRDKQNRQGSRAHPIALE